MACLVELALANNSDPCNLNNDEFSLKQSIFWTSVNMLFVTIRCIFIFCRLFVWKSSNQIKQLIVWLPCDQQQLNLCPVSNKGINLTSLHSLYLIRRKPFVSRYCWSLLLVISVLWILWVTISSRWTLCSWSWGRWLGSFLIQSPMTSNWRWFSASFGPAKVHETYADNSQNEGYIDEE